jgi:hypothetical protein
VPQVEGVGAAFQPGCSNPLDQVGGWAEQPLTCFIFSFFLSLREQQGPKFAHKNRLMKARGYEGGGALAWESLERPNKASVRSPPVPLWNGR